MSEQMQPAAEVVPQVAGKSFKWIAEYAYPNGSVLRCLPCKKQRNVTTSDIMLYMEIGWPRCKVCGHMTDLVNPYEKKY